MSYVSELVRRGRGKGRKGGRGGRGGGGGGSEQTVMVKLEASKKFVTLFPSSVRRSCLSPVWDGYFPIFQISCHLPSETDLNSNQICLFHLNLYILILMLDEDRMKI